MCRLSENLGSLYRYGFIFTGHQILKRRSKRHKYEETWCPFVRSSNPQLWLWLVLVIRFFLILIVTSQKQELGNCDSATACTCWFAVCMVWWRAGSEWTCSFLLVLKKLRLDFKHFKNVLCTNRCIIYVRFRPNLTSSQGNPCPCVKTFVSLKDQFVIPNYRTDTEFTSFHNWWKWRFGLYVSFVFVICLMREYKWVNWGESRFHYVQWWLSGDKCSVSEIVS